MALLFAVLVGIPLGLLSAYRRNSPIDVGTMIVANIGVSMPVFVLGLLLAFVFALLLKGTPFALPPSGRLSSGVEVMSADRGLASRERHRRRSADSSTSSPALHPDGADHGSVGPARRCPPAPDPADGRARHDPARDHRAHHPLEPARGPRPRLRPDGARQGPARAVRRPSSRNAQRAAAGRHDHRACSSAGSCPERVLTETVFNLTGVGRTLFEAITGRDYVVIQGFTLIVAFIYVAVNLLVDLSYAFLDPRVRQR